MRSLLISGSYFPPQVGGISTMMAEICAGLGEERVAVLTGVRGKLDDARLERIRIYRTDVALRPRSATATLCLIAKLGLALAKERPAVLQFATLEDAYLAYWTRRALGVKHIFYTHGNELLGAAKSPWDKPRAALMASACVVANSRYTEGLLKNLGFPADRIRVVHPGCDPARFRSVQVSEEARRRLSGGRPFARILLTVGNLVERKGHDTVIRALSTLSQGSGDIVYLIAGDGPYRATLERLAKSLGVADRVVFLGRVAEPDLPLLYSMADSFIMLSRERTDQCDVEGFGIVFVEAAACGTPAIAGRSGGVEDAVVDGATGLLVDPHDIAGVAHAITTLLSNRELTQRLGHAARKRAVSEFSWSRFGNSIAAILDDVGREGLRGARQFG